MLDFANCWGESSVKASGIGSATDASCHPGDRPIEITIERVWAALGWNARLQLLSQLVAGLAMPPPEIDTAKLKDMEADDPVEMMTQQLTEAYPQAPSLPLSASAFLHVFSKRKVRLRLSLPRLQAFLPVQVCGWIRGSCKHQIHTNL